MKASAKVIRQIFQRYRLLHDKILIVVLLIHVLTRDSDIWPWCLIRYALSPINQVHPQLWDNVKFPGPSDFSIELGAARSYNWAYSALYKRRRVKVTCIGGHSTATTYMVGIPEICGLLSDSISGSAVSHIQDGRCELQTAGEMANYTR